MQQKHWVYISSAFIGLALTALCIYLFQGSNQRIVPHNSKFDPYISAYTHGVISKKSSVKIVFQEKMVEIEKVDADLDNNFLSFSPSLNGKLKWINTRTLEFTPEKTLTQEYPYIGSLKFNKIFPKKLPDSLHLFCLLYTSPSPRD